MFTKGERPVLANTVSRIARGLRSMKQVCLVGFLLAHFAYSQWHLESQM